jgi:hypothetical protein
MCQNKSPVYNLPLAFVIVTVLMYGSKFLLEKFFTGVAASFLISMLFAGFLLPHVWLVAYNVPLSCSLRPGTVPICAVDEAVDFALHMLPRHIPWPLPVVNTTVRVPQKGLFSPVMFLPTNSVFNCRADPYGFTTGERYLLYAMERYVPHWRTYISQLSLSTFVGRKGVQDANYYYNKPLDSAIYSACSNVALPALIPLLFYAGVVIIFLIGAINIAFIFTLHVLRALRCIQDLMSEVYITVCEQAQEGVAELAEDITE